MSHCGKDWRKSGLAVAGIVTLFGLGIPGLASVQAWWTDTAWTDPANLLCGIICCLVAVLFMTVLHVRRESAILPEVDADTDEQVLRQLLDELGYHVGGAASDSWLAWPRFLAPVMGGPIRVQRDPLGWRLTGPRFWLEIARQRWREHRHFDHAQEAPFLADLANERYLKRVHLRLRVNGEQWHALSQAIVAPLQQHGELVCDLSVLVHSTAGIPESLLEW